MIDLHCHLLPCVDDGATSVNEALVLARGALADGITEVVLTPHIHPGRWEHTRASLLPRFEAFERVLRLHDIPLGVQLGAEVRLGPDTLAALESLPTIGTWRREHVLLLELPPGGVPPGTLNVVRPMRAQGVVPMIAHPERNREFIANRRKLAPFVAAGCLVQVTADSLVGRFGLAPRDVVFAIIEAGWATVVATDAHSAALRRPNLSAARRVLEERYGNAAARTLVSTHPRRILGRADEPDTVDAAAVRQLVAATTIARERALVVLAYAAGLRPNELVRLRRGDVDLERGIVHVRPAGPGEVERVCPITPDARPLLQDLALAPEGWVFPSRSRRTQPMTGATARMLFRGALERSGLDPRLDLRDLRRAYAIHQLKAGIDIGAIRRMLGHRTIAATLDYLKRPVRSPARDEA